MRKISAVLLLLFSLSRYSYCQDVLLDGLRSLIQADILTLRQQSANLTEYLTEAQEELSAAKLNSEKLSTQLTGLKETYSSTLVKLTDYEVKLQSYEERLHRRAKIITALSICLGVMILVKLAVGALRLKGYRLPWIIDWLA